MCQCHPHLSPSQSADLGTAKRCGCSLWAVSSIEEEYGRPLHMSLETYWSWREQQELRYEWVNGVVYAMTGASKRHVNVVRNLAFLFDSAVRSSHSQCLVGTNDLALLIQPANRVYYPDVVVACPGSADQRYETTPCLVVEVLSPSTQGRDRTVKLADYCTIPELHDYLMVSSDPDDPFVIQHHRAGDIWIHTVHGPPATVSLTCPAVSFQVSDLFT